ncbi:nucleotidyltransferase domain-containing protein [Candidatus Uhrbacteria bacterium]|nr:nucleotidyltransferase domain-containing protein [Candidatus Uhrbacteria bacterium]
MSRIETKKIVRRYAKSLKQAGYPLQALYLFGSHAKGLAHQWSDIDVAIISDRLKKNREKNSFLLWKLRRDIDTRIEPHGFTVKEFSDAANPMAAEVKKTGIKIL